MAESITLNPERPAYVPPHLRNRPQAAAPPPQAFHSPPATAHAPIPATNGTNGYHPQTGLPTPAPTPTPPRGPYVPPTARLGATASTLDAGGWGATGKPSSDVRSYGGGGGGAPPGDGLWKNGHVIGQRNQTMEKELYGDVGDGAHVVSRCCTALSTSTDLV